MSNAVKLQTEVFNINNLRNLTKTVQLTVFCPEFSTPREGQVWWGNTIEYFDIIPGNKVVLTHTYTDYELMKLPSNFSLPLAYAYERGYTPGVKCLF